MNDDRKKPRGGKGRPPGGGGSADGRGPKKSWSEGRKPGADAPKRGSAFGKAKPWQGGEGKRPGKPGFAGERTQGERPRPPRDEVRSDRAGEASGPRSSYGKAKPWQGGEGKRPARPGFAGERMPGERPRPPRDTARSESTGVDGGTGGRFRSDARPRFERDRKGAPEGADRSGPRPAQARAPRFERAKAAPVSEPAEAGERIAKRLARVGIASRRDAEELIAAGRVRVNGKVLSSPAFNVQPDDRIELDGTEIPPVERTRLFLFHKPAGLVTTNRDPEGRKTVFDALPDGLPRLITVGRLDINTEGLLLLTNDGGLARVLELPSTGWLRRYRARVHGKVEQATLDGLKDGIAVDGVFYGSVEATLDREQGSNAWLTIGLREGKNREVKNILGALGLEVSRLIRISFGPFQLGELDEGHVLEVKGRTLRDQLGERLVEESGANFEAEIAKPFSNKPTRAARQPTPVEDDKLVRWSRDGFGTTGEGGLIKKRRFDKQDQREKVLGRLTTKPGARGSAGGGKREREEKAPEPKRGRSANVWMAPGARPQGKGRVAAEKAEAEEKRASGRPAGKPRFDKAGGAASAPRSQAPREKRGDGPAKTGKPFAPRPARDGASREGRPQRDGSKGPRKGRDDADRRR